MIRRFLFSFVINCVLLTWLHAQQYEVTGVVQDTSHNAMPSATVVSLNQSDSLLVGFGFTDDKGRFKLKDHKPGNYIVQVTFIGYQQYSSSFTVEDTDVDLGVIPIQVDVQHMDQVTITGEHTPITIQKDTITYNAAAFQSQPNDVIEDLLKKMPGIEVEDDGTIKAQGKRCNKS